MSHRLTQLQKASSYLQAVCRKIFAANHRLCFLQQAVGQNHSQTLDRIKSRSKLHNKEFLIALMLEDMGHSSCIMPKWWIPKSILRLPAKRPAESQSQQISKMHHLSCTTSLTFLGELNQQCLLAFVLCAHNDLLTPLQAAKEGHKGPCSGQRGR